MEPCYGYNIDAITRIGNYFHMEPCHGYKIDAITRIDNSIHTSYRDSIQNEYLL